MKLIVGLGNPGKAYIRARHNAGYLCVDFFQQHFGFPTFTLDRRRSAVISAKTIGTEKVWLVKPDVLMNTSGAVVVALLHFFNLAASDLAIIHDDMDIALGTYKKTLSSRAAGHNGVQNIIDRLNTQDFLRFRLGIGRPVEVLGACMPAHDFVLQDFSATELALLESVFPHAGKDLAGWLHA